METQPAGAPSSGTPSPPEAERQPSEMLKDLILRWFLETQAAVLLQDGTLPNWFHGFITRQQTEMLLGNRDFGCFLIRLNERSFGYILSYRSLLGLVSSSTLQRSATLNSVLECGVAMQVGCFASPRGKNRCRHFVISCQRNRHYVVSGDTRTHQSLAELIRYYQMTEIQPFGENLTSACSKLEEKSIYDEISSGRSSSAAAPTLIGNPSTDSLVSRSHSNQQPGNPRIQLQEEEKSFFKESQSSGPKDLDAVPPVPDRSHLLKSLSLEEGVGGKGIIYSTVKKSSLDKRCLEKSKEGCRDFVDAKAEKTEGLGQSLPSPCQKKTGTVFALAKQSDTPFTQKVNPAETPQPGTVYSKVALDHAKSCWVLAEPHSCQSFPSSKKSAVNVPNYPPPKLTPKLLNKPQNLMEFHEQQSPLGIYTSPESDKEHGQLNQLKSLFELPKEPTDEKIFKVKNHQPTLWTDNTTNTHESFRWAKSIFLGSEKVPKTSLTKSKGSRDHISTKFGQSSKIQINPEDPYEKIPDPYSKGSSTTGQASTLEDPYERIPYMPGKRIEAKLTPKSDKPRRFFFAEKKARP